MVDEVIKDLIKKAQTATISVAIGGSMMQMKSKVRRNSEHKCKRMISNVKADMNIIIAQTSDSIEGQFGDRVKDSFDIQKDILDSF